jgi:hypothetical protein
MGRTEPDGHRNEDVVSTVFCQGTLEGRGITDGSADGVQASDGLDIVPSR